ncbi:hypothetical protein TNCV_2339321 [Trichonephila clavipes]|nr:hypothetical protein TNCV_2339321 [Trichonephila clavipes]
MDAFISEQYVVVWFQIADSELNENIYLSDDEHCLFRRIGTKFFMKGDKRYQITSPNDSHETQTTLRNPLKSVGTPTVQSRFVSHKPSKFFST